jgi:hypothetical protein
MKLTFGQNIYTMKKIILSLTIVLAGLSAAKAQTTNVPADAAKPQVAEVKAVNPKAADIKFSSLEIDYGTIEHNADGNREFKFKNVGKEPLIIANCQGSCGCTVPTWPKEPIMPKQSGVIKVKYATDRVGHFQKNITVTSNAKIEKVILTIKGDVKPDANPTPVTPATDKKSELAPAQH